MKEHYQSLIAGGIFAITPAVLLGKISSPIGLSFFCLFAILSIVFIFRALYQSIPVPFDSIEREEFLADHPEAIQLKKTRVINLYDLWKREKIKLNKTVLTIQEAARPES